MRLLLFVSIVTPLACHTIINNPSLKLCSALQQRLLTIIDQVQNAQHKEMLSALHCLKCYLQHIMQSSTFDIAKKFILTHRLEHIEHAIYRYKRSLSWWERSHHYLEHAYQAVQHKRSSDTEWKKLCTSHPLAHALLDYIDIENDYMLTDYRKALTFFSLCNRYENLPFVLNFWSSPSVQKELAYRFARIMPTTIEPQALLAVGEFIANQAMHLAPVALQATLMGGQSMYGEWISKKAQKRVAELATQQKQLRDSYQEFIVEQNNSQAAKINKLIKDFSANQKSINTSYKEFAQVQQQNYAYLLQSINLEQPKAHYLMYPISFDQLFAAGIMNTPLKERYPWYNIYQERAGNWAFDKGFFYQRSLVNYGTPYWDQGSTNPEALSIFNEWSPSALPYRLVIDIHLVEAHYPFFIGVMFNKARWISGDPERLNRYRLLGLYAPKADDLAFWFAEQTISFNKEVESIISPLQTIATKKAHLIKTINPVQAQALATEALDYRIELTIDDKTIKYVIKTPQTVLAMGSLSKLDHTMALYHGFGFIAAGCKARFTIVEPTELSYNQGL